MPVPRLHVGARRRAGVGPRAAGTSSTSTTRSSRCPRPRSARGAGSCSSTPIPMPGRSTSSSATCPSTSIAGSSRTATSRATCKGDPGQLEDRPGGVLRVVPRRRRRIRRPRPTSATSTARSTSGTTSRRVITPGGTPSPLLGGSRPRRRSCATCSTSAIDEERYISLADGQTAREVSAAAARERWRPVVGDMVDEWCDAEFIDNIDYTLFPNFHPWGAYNRIVYRFRPNGDNHREALMDVYLLAPFSGERPPAGRDHLPRRRRRVDRRARTRHAGQGVLPGQLQHADGAEGPRDDSKAGVTLANYQESKVRWMHDLLGRWVEGTG